MQVQISAENKATFLKALGNEVVEPTPKIQFLKTVIDQFGIKEGDKLFSARIVVDSVGTWKEKILEGIAAFGATGQIVQLFAANRDVPTEPEIFAFKTGTEEAPAPPASNQLTKAAFKIAAFDYSITIAQLEDNTALFMLIGTDKETEEEIARVNAEAKIQAEIAQVQMFSSGLNLF